MSGGSGEGGCTAALEAAGRTADAAGRTADTTGDVRPCTSGDVGLGGVGGVEASLASSASKRADSFRRCCSISTRVVSSLSTIHFRSDETSMFVGIETTLAVGGGGGGSG